MLDWMTILMILICIEGTALGSEIPPGDTVVVPGVGSDGNVDVIPVYQGGSISSPIYEFRNPSQYTIPEIKSPTSKDSDSNKNDTTSYDNTDGSATKPLVIHISGAVKGTGNFSQWSKILKGSSKVTQTASARNGTIEQSKSVDMGYERSNTSSKAIEATAVSLKEDVTFTGKGYAEWNSFSNGPDMVRDSFQAGAIKKASSFIGWSSSVLNKTYSDDNGGSLDWNQDRYTGYNIDTRLVGISKFNVITSNSTLENEYTGLINLKTSLIVQDNLKGMQEVNSSIPCCTVPWEKAREAF